MNQKIKNLVLTLLPMTIISYIFMMLSGQNPANNMNLSGDSSIYAYIGKAISTYDIALYKDIFTHKGPLLYLIQSVGFGLFDSPTGIWVLEIIFMALNLTLVVYISKLFTKNNWIALANVFTYCVSLFKYFQAGNLTEEYVLLFIFISLYIFSKFLLNPKKLPTFGIIITGICFGSMLMIRPNMFGIWFGFCIIIVAYFIIEKRYIDIAKCIGLFIAGIVLLILPFIIYLNSKSALSDFIYSYWTYNFLYIGKSPDFISTIKNLFSNARSFVTIPIFISVIVNIILILRSLKTKKHLALYIASLAGLCTSLLLLFALHHIYLHYLMVILPFFIMPFAYLLEYLGNLIKIKSNNKLNYAINATIVVLCTLVLLAPQLPDFFKGLKKSHELQVNYYNSTTHYLENGEIVKYVIDNTSIDDKIIVIGTNADIYLKSGRQASNKYACQTPVYELDPKAQKEFDDHIKNFDGSMIIMMHYSYDNYPNVQSYLDEYVEQNRFTKHTKISEFATIYTKVDK